MRDFGDRPALFLQDGLEVFLDALLRVITDRARRRLLPDAAFALGNSGVLFRLRDPLKRNFADAHRGTLRS